MSLAVWLGEDRKCSAAVVGLDLLLGLSMVRRCSLNRSFKRLYDCTLSNLQINILTIYMKVNFNKMLETLIFQRSYAQYLY